VPVEAGWANANRINARIVIDTIAVFFMKNEP
jgi:hypothetical protein